MKNFIISEGLRNELLQYLASRPLQEVLNGYMALQTLPEHKENSDDGAAEVKGRQRDQKNS